MSGVRSILRQRSLGRVTVAVAVAPILGCSPIVVEVDADTQTETSTSAASPLDGSSTGDPVPVPPPVDEPVPPPEPSTSSGGDGSSESSGGIISGVLEPGDPSECLVGGNMLVMDGDAEDYIHPGYEVLPPGTWTIEVAGDPLDDIELGYQFGEPPGEWMYWDVWLRTSLVPAPLEVGAYGLAQRAPFEDEGHPGLWVSGENRGGNRVLGSFEIHELEVVDGSVSNITATWEQHCEAGKSVMYGCVHWEL